MPKLLCYVDETGQDTQGRLFVVALVFLEGDRQPLRAQLRRIETTSGKRQKKWKKTVPPKKRAYIEAVLALPSLHGRLLYAEYSGSTDYEAQTIDAIARGILRQARGRAAYRVSVFLDALGRERRKVVGAALRSRGIRVEKVRGLRDEADEFIRVADALAGFVRDALEGQEPWKELYEKALHRGVLKKL